MTEEEKKKNRFFSLRLKKRIARKFWRNLFTELFRLIALLIKEFELNGYSKNSNNGLTQQDEKKIWVKRNLFRLLKAANIRFPFFPPYLERVIVALLVDLLIDFLEYFDFWRKKSRYEDSTGEQEEE